MRPITPRTAVVAVSVLVLAGGLAWGLKKWMAEPKATSYLTAKVARADLESAVMATGVLQAIKQVDVGAQVSGQLKSLKVQLGDKVTKGQLLAEIDPILPENNLRSAQASMDSLQAQKQASTASLWQAEAALQRQQEMIKKDATSRQEVDAAKAQAQVIKANIASYDAQLRQAKTQVDSAKASLAYTKIEAPMDGEVTAIVTQEGQTVVAAQQAPVILKLANLEQMTVRAQISEADVMRVGLGYNAYFTILGNAETRYTGKLRAIEPAPMDGGVNATKVAGPVFYNALFDVPNQNHALRIGMTAQVAIVLKQANGVLTVPTSALGARDDKGRYAVRVMKGQAIKTVNVPVGVSNNINIEVLNGLNEGDEVITDEVPTPR